MKHPEMESSKNRVLTMDIFIRFVVLAGLLAWCGMILAPFIFILIWGMILAISTYPLYSRCIKSWGIKKGWITLLFTLVGLVLIAIPGYLIINNIIAAVTQLKSAYSADTLHLPPPPTEVSTWPLIGKPLFDLWSLASTNITEAIHRYETQLMPVLTWLVGAVGKLGLALLKFILSIVVAGVLMHYDKPCEKFTDRFFSKLLGARGPLFADIAEKTIRNVARGIIGVAFLQAAAAGLGLYLGGVPWAGPLTLLCLMLCIIQIGVGIVVIPVIIYAFTTFGTLHATLLTIWLTLIMFSDNILKPIFLSKGAPVPTLVIFLGSLGGFLLNGIIGLFIGAVVLALGYRLLMAWIETDSNESAPGEANG